MSDDLREQIVSEIEEQQDILLHSREAELLRDNPALQEIFSRVETRILSGLDVVSLADHPKMALELLRQRQVLFSLKREIAIWCNQADDASKKIDLLYQELNGLDKIPEFTRD